MEMRIIIFMRFERKAAPAMKVQWACLSWPGPPYSRKSQALLCVGVSFQQTESPGKGLQVSRREINMEQTELAMSSELKVEREVGPEWRIKAVCGGSIFPPKDIRSHQIILNRGMRC